MSRSKNALLPTVELRCVTVLQYWEKGCRRCRGSSSQVTGNEICKIHIYIYIVLELDRGLDVTSLPSGREGELADRKAGQNVTDSTMGWGRERGPVARAQSHCFKEPLQAVSTYTDYVMWTDTRRRNLRLHVGRR